MAVIWKPADEDTIDLAEELIDKHHPHLTAYRVGIIFRSERSTSNGRDILGQASKVSDKFNALLPLEERLHFLIWLAEDWWNDASDAHREALLDHELCHCGLDGKMRQHDVNEFIEIVHRHGLWYRELEYFSRAAHQHTLPGIAEELAKTGAVLSVNPAYMISEE